MRIGLRSGRKERASHVPGFDVFISYAHIDNDREYPDQQGWITVLQSALGKRLSRELGRVARVFWDQRELDGNRLFDETIRAACAEARVMLAIVSPRYVVSPSCRKEVEYFSELSLAHGDLSRLITVRKTPVSESLQVEAPPALARILSETLGYQFYDHDERGVRRDFQIYDAELRPRFDRRLDELVQDVARYLLNTEPGPVSRAAPASARASGPPPSSGRSGLQQIAETAVDGVFLAATGSDSRHLRDSLHLELSDRGVKVTAPSNWEDDREGVTRELSTALAGVGLSVHIVGGAVGARPDGCEQALPEFQFDWVEALARGRAEEEPLLRLVWLCPDAEPKTEPHRAFLARLRACDAWRDEDELLSGRYEELSERVTKKLTWLATQREARKERELEAERARQRASLGVAGAPQGAGAVRKVYVISEPEDHERAALVERALQSRQIEVLSAAEITVDAQTEQEREQLHQEYLEQSDAFLIYHGRSKFRWVRAQADEARKVAGRSGRTEIAGAVYVAQPLEGPKATYELVGIQRCDESQVDPEGVLKHFVDRVGGSNPPGAPSK